MGYRPHASRPRWYWNAYRPSYRHSTRRHKSRGYSRRRSSHSRSPSPYEGDFYRPDGAPPIQKSLHDSDDDEILPKAWDDDLQNLIDRTHRAYNLVINYERDSEGGRRWSRDDIDDIYDMGKYLEADLHDLKHWRRALARKDSKDETIEKKIKENAEKMRDCCTEIQDAIKKRERLPRKGDRHRHRRRRRRHRSSSSSDAKESFHRRSRRSHSPSPEPESRRRVDRSRSREHAAADARRRGIVGRLGKHIMHY